MINQIQRIPLYSEMVNDYTHDEIIQAGYFRDDYDGIDVIKELKGTHFNYIRHQDVCGVEYNMVVALSGCFSPIHAGHIQALTKAKEHYEQLGYTVMGVLIPAHDSYVSGKRGGTCRMSAMDRILKIKEYLEVNGIDWIVVDEHPALVMHSELNFPYLIKRLEQLYSSDTKIAFVFGGDNVEFAYAMSYTEHYSFVVNRIVNGVDFTDRINTVKNKLDSKNRGELFTICYDNEYAELSSSIVRKTEVQSKKEGVYLIRADASQYPTLPHNSIEIEKKIINKLTEIFREENIPVLVMPIEQQLNVFHEYMKKHKKPNTYVVSLDKWCKADFLLDASRMFSECGFQGKSKNLIVRNKMEFEFFLDKIKDGDTIVIIDDDRSTGFTMEQITKLTKSILKNTDVTFKYEYVNEVFLKQFCGDMVIYDIVDTRDFIIDAPYGGLMTNVGRAPYVYPYVNTNARAKIPTHKMMEFSQFVLMVNGVRHWYNS